MKPRSDKATAKKVMRVATALTGVSAGIAVLGPAQMARAATSASPPATSPYKIWVDTALSVSKLQVCAYKSIGGGTGQWQCTAVQSNPHFTMSSHPAYMGSDWRKGLVRVWEWDSYQGYGEFKHSCNTNGTPTAPYWGVHRAGGVSLSLEHASNQFGAFPLGLPPGDC